MRHFLIVLGLILIILGLIWPWIKKLGFGHLPGDIIINKEHFSFYFPIITCITCIVISLIISILLWFLNK